MQFSAEEKLMYGAMKAISQLFLTEEISSTILIKLTTSTKRLLSSAHCFTQESFFFHKAVHLKGVSKVFFSFINPLARIYKPFYLPAYMFPQQIKKTFIILFTPSKIVSVLLIAKGVSKVFFLSEISEESRI